MWIIQFFLRVLIWNIAVLIYDNRVLTLVESMQRAVLTSFDNPGLCEANAIIQMQLTRTESVDGLRITTNNRAE